MVKNSIIAEYKKEFIKNILYFHNYVKIMNGSKMFAGLVVITLYIASRFVTIKLSKSMESYFFRQLIVPKCFYQSSNKCCSKGTLSRQFLRQILSTQELEPPYQIYGNRFGPVGWPCKKV